MAEYADMISPTVRPTVSEGEQIITPDSSGGGDSSTIQIKSLDNHMAPFPAFNETVNIMSESMMSHYHTLIGQQAQAAAAMMVLGPSATLTRESVELHLTGSRIDHSLPISTAPSESHDEREVRGHVIDLSGQVSLTGGDGKPSDGSNTQPPIGDSTTKPTKGKARRMNAKDRTELFKCPLCSYQSKWAHGLSNHMRTHNDTVFKCPDCDYSTPWKGDLTNHKRLHTGNMFTCTECDFKTYRKQGLEKHMAFHSGARPHKCTECNHTSSNSSNLKKHMMIHTGEKPVACELCPYRCRQYTQLRVHVQQHHCKGGKSTGKPSSKQRRYHCVLCGVLLSSKQSFNKHMISQHNCTKPFVCGYICQQAFNTQQECDRHSDSHHLVLEQSKKQYQDASTNTEALNVVEEVDSHDQYPGQSASPNTVSLPMENLPMENLGQYSTQPQHNTCNSQSDVSHNFNIQSDQSSSCVYTSQPDQPVQSKMTYYHADNLQPGSYESQSLHMLQPVSQSSSVTHIQSSLKPHTTSNY